MLEYSMRMATLAMAVPRQVKSGVVIAVDTAICILSVWLAFYLRLGEFIPLTISAPMLWVVAVSVILAVPIFVKFGLYRAIFRYSGMPAMIAIVQAMILYVVLFAALFTIYGVQGVPRTIGLIQPLLMLVFIGASRAAARLWLGGLYQSQIQKSALPQVLIYGAGIAGRQLASAMSTSHEMRVVGFLDDDERLHGHVLNGLPIYEPAKLQKLLNKLPVTDVLLALPSMSRQRRNDILAALSPYKLVVRTLPSLSDIATGKVSLSDVRELDIHDLLGREPVTPSASLLKRDTRDKTVLVTGAGGSIGSELCRQIIKSKPKKLLLVEMSEFALYQIHREIQHILVDETSEQVNRIEVIPLLASVCDEVRMCEIMATWRPDTIYHAAAYKHVPIVEHNPSEGVKNNVLGTLNIAVLARIHGVSSFVLISTDKAVRPTNIMGASKRLAEMVLQAQADLVAQTSGQTCFSMVRFGNVLGSSGSVVPLFRQQIKNGGPITLTDERITRFFMSIPEAAQLVIQAGAMASGGDVFVLDMGEPVRIIDLAKRMVELSGLSLKDNVNPNGDIEIHVTGLRPGEKLYEELLIGNNPIPTSHNRIMKAHEDFLLWVELERRLVALKSALEVNDVPLIRFQLKELVPGYRPDGEVVDWVWSENHRLK